MAEALSSTSDRASLAGRVLAGKYEILSLTGTGAMGSVYRARQLTLQKIVAVKVLHRELERDASFVDRFHVEAHAASRLDHPSSTRVVDFGAEPDGLLYIVMEYLEGRTLADVIEQEWPLGRDRIVSIVMQVLAALAVAHEMGILHRDLKPENIMVLAGVGDDGEPVDRVKVCDFGIAKMTGMPDLPRASSHDPRSTGIVARVDPLRTIAGLVIGTPAYMSPEQATSSPLDSRTDIYSLGVVLYELLSGGLPFSAETPLLLALMHTTAEPVDLESIVPALDSRLVQVCAKAMQKRPENRYGSAREMRVALRAVLRPHSPSSPSLLRPPPSSTSSTLVEKITAPAPPDLALAIETPASAGLAWRGGLVALAVAVGLALAWPRLATSPAPTPIVVAAAPSATAVIPFAPAAVETQAPTASASVSPAPAVASTPAQARRPARPASSNEVAPAVPSAPVLLPAVEAVVAPPAVAAPPTTPLPVLAVTASAPASPPKSAFDPSRGKVIVGRMTADRLTPRAVTDVLRRADLEGCYRATLRALGSAGPPSAVLRLEFDQLAVSSVRVEAPSPVPGMQRCIEARLASVRVGEADTGAASASIELQLVPAP